MKTNANDMDDLLVKELTGEATTAERALVQQWLAEDPSHQHYYEHFKLIWEESVQLTPTLTLDEDAAWQRFQQRVENSPKVTPQKAPVFFMQNTWMRVAAILILAIGIGWLSYSLFSTSEVTIANIQTADKVQTDTLPDGSFVTLNKRSELSYPAKFAGKTRPVTMKGEAFFHVSPNKEKPFIIKAGEVTVQVVGTSFNVNTKADSTEVIVETGVVNVSANNQTVTLQAGEKIVIHHNQNKLEKEKTTDKLYNYYRSHKFECDGTPLWKLVQMLNEAYDANIEIQNNELNNLPLTVVFVNESLESILAVLEETDPHIHVVRENGRIILR